MINIAREAVQEHGALQRPGELAELLRIVAYERPRRVLEIGSARGGTLWAWRQVLGDEAQIISLDCDHGQLAYRDGVTLITGDSQSPETLQQVQEIMPDPAFLFIDGDHDQEPVRQDFLMYGALVRAGGIVALHDIMTDTCGVPNVWAEIRRNHLTMEIVSSQSTLVDGRYFGGQWGGIGVARIGGSE